MVMGHHAKTKEGVSKSDWKMMTTNLLKYSDIKEGTFYAPSGMIHTVVH